MKIANRAEDIAPFYVMEVVKKSQEIEASLTNSDEPMIHLSIGEPDFTAPTDVRQAAIANIESAQTQYTQALGLDSLRNMISNWYHERYQLDIPSARIIITAGASAALKLTCLALINPGDEILLPDPCYPCNKHFVIASGGTPIMIPTNEKERFQLSLEKVKANWNEKTRGVLIASPSNPTGTSIERKELLKIHQFVKSQGGITIIDELYLGLSYEDEFSMSALSLDSDIISINSFSKYFSMTGWRLGWMVVPEALVPVIERLAQNFFLCPSTIAQHAAISCFTEKSLSTYEAQREEYRQRRDWIAPALNEVGLTVPVMPDGAFYVWADCSKWCEAWQLESSWEFTFELMERAHIAVSPGRDFGEADTKRYIRISTATPLEQLQQAIERLKVLKPF